MKRGTIGHGKVARLARVLKLERWGAVGILESLWHAARDYAPAGDIGRFSDADIAFYVGWEGDGDTLVGALLESGWLEGSDQHRLVVHDWRDHCEDAVHMKLARATEVFADGTVPNMSRLGAQERGLCEQKYQCANAARTANARQTHAVHTALPSQSLPTHPLPSPPLPPPSEPPEPEEARVSSVPIGLGGIGIKPAITWNPTSLKNYLLACKVNPKTAAELSVHAGKLDGVDLATEWKRIVADKNRVDKSGTLVGWIEKTVGIERATVGSIIKGLKFGGGA